MTEHIACTEAETEHEFHRASVTRADTTIRLSQLYCTRRDRPGGLSPRDRELLLTTLNTVRSAP